MNNFIKEVFKYLGWVLFFIFMWFKGCSRIEKASDEQSSITPKIEAKFTPKKPIHKTVVSKIEYNEISTSRHQETDTVFKENPIDQKLLSENEKIKCDFEKETDSLKKIILYSKAVQLNQFSTKFEDSNVLININGIVQGEVKEIKPNYTIKEKEKPKQKETVFRLLGGFELGNNKQLNDFKVKGNIMFQNRKGNIISGSFDTNQNVWIGYNFSVFSIKR
jgi:hypothetical protein